MAFDPPPLPSGPFSPEQFQVWWQQTIDGLKAELGALDAAIAAQAAAEAAADAAVAAAAQAAEYMADLPTITITADYLGVVTPSNQLPKTTLCQRFNDTMDVSALSTWSAVARSGGASVSIDSATGALTLNAITSSDVVDVTSERTVGGVLLTLTKPQPYNLAPAGAPPSGGGGGGGGTTDSTSSFADINSATHAVIASLSAEAGAGGIVTLGAPLAVLTAEAPPDGVFKVWGKWQWWNGAAWVDLAAEVASSPNCRVVFDIPSGEYIEYNGAFSVPDSKTGLTPATSYDFQLLARNDSGTRVMSFSGTASAVGS